MQSVDVKSVISDFVKLLRHVKRQCLLSSINETATVRILHINIRIQSELMCSHLLQLI